MHSIAVPCPYNFAKVFTPHHTLFTNACQDQGDIWIVSRNPDTEATMVNNRRRVQWLAVILGVMALSILLSASSIDIARNDDGSLTVTSSMTEASLSAEMGHALDQLQNVSVDLQDGTMIFSADRPRPDGSQIDNVQFRVDLGNNNGQLTASISEFTVNGQPGNDERVAQWNERIAQRLERQAERHPDRSLESVTITDSDVTLVWHVETERSQQND
jgi:hypothetical protein